MRRSRRRRSSGATGSARTTYTNAAKGGIPASLYPLTQCTVATRDLAAYPGGEAFLKAYKAKYGGASPDPYAIYGYEAMKLGARHHRGPRGAGQQQVGRAEGVVRDEGAPVCARHLRVRPERRHDAEVLRPVQDRGGRRARLFKTLTPQEDSAGLEEPVGGAHCAPSTAVRLNPLDWDAGCNSVRKPWKPNRSCHPPPAAPRRVLAGVRRYVGRWGLVAALVVLPVYYGIHRPDGRLPGRRRGRPTGDQARSRQVGLQLRRRPLQRRDLGPNRDRVHARLRDHRADQLRARRRVHDRLFRRRRPLGDFRARTHHRSRLGC